MSKEKQEAVNSTETGVAVVETAFNWDAIEQATEKQSLDFTYLKMEPGEARRFVFGGIFEQEINGKPTTMAGLYAKEGAFISASHMIVQACQKIQEGQPIEIVFKGEKALPEVKKSESLKLAN